MAWSRRHDECDDGIHLRRELSGKRWDELSPEVLFHGSIGLPLLEPNALVAFLPAWLLRSMETSDLDHPIVLEFTLYFLCPGTELETLCGVWFALVATKVVVSVGGRLPPLMA